MSDNDKPQRRRVRTRRSGDGDPGERARSQSESPPPRAKDDEDTEAGSDRVIRRRRVRSRGRSADEPTKAAEHKAEKSDATSSDRPKKSPRKKATPPVAKQQAKRQQTKKKPAQESESDGDSGSDTSGSTRLQARRQRDGQTARNRGGATTKDAPARGRGGRSGSKRGGRRPVGAVDEETRRAIAGGPPRRMLVSVGEERTQVAVLEERQLVEHFVTRKSDVSYVGNIYQGRVQNVLPGMEAAFLDIGKGRNGVLYAGEVDYEDTDFEGELPRIEQALKPGQTVLVQVTKDPMGSKGARLTQRLSIAGRYCVLAPGEGMLGISRKLPDDERERLRKILKDIKPEDFGLIVRTAAEDATREQLEADVARLERIWSEVSARAEKAKALDTVYEEPNLVIRVIRDVFGPEYTDLIVDSDELAEQVRDYLSDVAPDLVERVSVHKGDDTLFDAYEVTTQIRRALEKKVWLASGGYLIIEKTEAMWVIDVNTGKFVGQDNLEETVLRNNLEAAEEIARQLRLRDMGGIIVIDFVDMLVPANRDEVLKRFRRELARDKTKSRVMEISKLGLVQMTRKNVSQGLTEVFTKNCDPCEGRGAQILDSAFQ